MAPKGFKLGGRGRRQIKGSIGGGGGVRVRSKGRTPTTTTPTTTTPTTPTTPTTTTPTVPDFTKNPIAPWDNNTKIGQLFNQGLVKLPSLNKAVTGLDPRVKMVAGDSIRERIETVNRIAAAKRPATSPMDPRIKATGVAGDSGRERVSTYNRIASGRSPLQRPAQLSRMGGTQRGSAVARASSASLRAGAAAARTARPAASSQGSAPRSAAPAAARPAAKAQPKAPSKPAPAPAKKRTASTSRKAL